MATSPFRSFDVSCPMVLLIGLHLIKTKYTFCQTNEKPRDVRGFRTLLSPYCGFSLFFLWIYACGTVIRKMGKNTTRNGTSNSSVEMPSDKVTAITAIAPTFETKVSSLRMKRPKRSSATAGMKSQSNRTSIPKR